MASFMEELWSSIFVPGPTRTLLIATNASFAALQLLLFILGLATYSIHFVVLSLLSAGLWYSINWFAREVRLAQAAQEAEKAKQEEREAAAAARKTDIRPVDSGDSETETETLVKSTASAASPAVMTGSEAVSSGLQPLQRDTKKRLNTGGDSSGYGSTDSEWEKVDDSKDR
ncbi:hypothetical protein N7539_004356 [Penicillium diatomitis]|uniref:ER membrane protein (Pkr1) n=1 Tax=Penicillium diatomitis TaxID=2819901 RepID=A0A9W9XDZ0_9EURO|nr:uncharacterized protein N7539_004356 [Penicillium diatomitis]KAJ5489466.1 hypothetical protein N7539_004356 [Penicillium diatomitis]